MDKFIEKTNSRIEYLEAKAIEYPTSFYFEGCLSEAKYLRDLFIFCTSKELEVTNG